MLIVGAKGFAKELLQVLYQIGELDNLVFFDNVNDDLPEKLYNRFKILRSFEDAEWYLKNVDLRFALGIGNPTIRKQLASKFIQLSGKITTIISPMAHVGDFGNIIGEGVNLMTGSVITCDVNIEEGVLINLNCTIGHDSSIGKFTELSPGVHVSGRCKIGEFCNVGTGTVILPDISLGNNVVIGAGSVITKNIEDNSLVMGVPGKIGRKLEPLNH